MLLSRRTTLPMAPLCWMLSAAGAFAAPGVTPTPAPFSGQTQSHACRVTAPNAHCRVVEGHILKCEVESSWSDCQRDAWESNIAWDTLLELDIPSDEWKGFFSTGISKNVVCEGMKVLSPTELKCLQIAQTLEFQTFQLTK